MGANILVVDDEESIRFSLKGILEDEGHVVAEAPDAESALETIQGNPPDLVFLDIWLTGMDGIQALEMIRPHESGIPVVMISGHGSIETAVAAIKNGAFDFIEKPLSLEKVLITTEKALEFNRLRRENADLRSRIGREQVRAVSGESPAVETLKEQIAKVAPTDSWVLITGENGTGKEIVARAVHHGSRRAGNPLVAVNCAAIPEELIESELFGHEKGAFTGADKAADGKFTMAHTGTLFLDEIGDMSLKTQAKILRILQEQSFERVGGRKTIRVDVRVIAATNKNLEEEIQKGAFREDLYYRLKVFPLHVPPLRERREDIPGLIDEFVERLSRENGFKPVLFTEDAVRRLMAHSWPGNVRELKNFVERMLIMHMGDEVDAKMLPSDVCGKNEPPAENGSGMGGFAGPDDGPVDFKAARNAFERSFLESKLREYDGNMSRLAEAIGLERSYLYRKLKAHGVNTGD